MNEKTVKIVIFEWASLAALFLSCFIFLYTQINKLDEKLEKQGARTDRLYEMFIDLLKEGKNN